MVARPIFVGVLLILGAVHLLFAAANFGLGEVAEGVVAGVAGLSLLAAILSILRGATEGAALLVLLGSLPLTVWFLFTVPLGWSTPSLLIASLPTPIAAALYLTGRRLRGR